ncbi:hypothetical protein [Novosphingobium panipatense]|uniref:Uncharacterized protein n=1 Tax=Novosphingobium panipatense TaxID=428991 RepID=A0ABY1QW85_9SPHN|nr:hypothetical protein [Novosphingobium panipatense]SMP82787.1 hypothetical protein SAMN06296065_1292 [Novosphingobium panipatense]
MKLRMPSLAASAALLLIAPSAQAQKENSPGQIAESAVGQVGQRQTAKTIETGPIGRVNSRIQNRVQNRIRNRIDRFYDPAANTTSPFEVAAEQTTRGQPVQ